MIHTTNEYTAQHHRYLLSGVTIGLKSLDGKAGAGEEGDKGEHFLSSLEATPYDLMKIVSPTCSDQGALCSVFLFADL